MKLELICEKPKGQAHATPLLFVHGKWHAAWCWAEHFLPYFAGHGYTSYALSLRGHGASEARERLRWTSIADYVADVTQVAGQMETPPALIGHSMGGFITQKYLETHTAPAAILLTSIPPSGLWPTTWLVFRRHPGVFMKALATLRLYPMVGTPALAREALFSANMPGEKAAAYQKRLQDESFRAYLDELGLNLVRPKRVTAPLLVIGAENDTVIPLKGARATAQAYRTEAALFPNMAHDVMLEEGWKAVADRILEFLKERGL
ncbi:MAG: alpha/beta hydrolase [Chloroflexi bacterium]|nr:alpha/beta hydrolase [Chloroflexota bacterium]